MHQQQILEQASVSQKKDMWTLRMRLHRQLGKQVIQVQFLDQEDPLEKEMATHSSILAWEITRTEKPRGLQSMGLQRVGQD